MKILPFALGFTLFTFPAIAQDNRPYSTCTEAASRLAKRLAKDNIEVTETPRNVMALQTVRVVLPKHKQRNEYSPTNRQYSYVVHFAGQRSVDLMASPVLLGELANTWFSTCSDAATLTFAVFGSGYATTFGVEEGGIIKQWGCVEDLGYIHGRGGNSDQAPNWGYDFCSI